jgi:hypothetical protein
VLYFSRAELKPGCIPLATFMLGPPEHLSSNPLPSRRRIDIHAAQLERVSRGALQTECADHRVGSDGHPKASIPFAVVGRDTINFFFERALYIRLECAAEIGGAQESVDRNEEVPDLGGILIGKRSDRGHLFQRSCRWPSISWGRPAPVVPSRTITCIIRSVDGGGSTQDNRGPIGL